MLNGPVPPLVVVVASIVLGLVRQRTLAGQPKRGWLGDLAVMAAIISIAALLELAMGRPLTYTKGPVRLWSGDIRSDQNSQQIADPYTVTHVVHGALFYGVTFALFRAPVGVRAIAATTIEAAWEAYENTDQVINRYRTETISLGYYGDSVINSVADMLACVAGFFLARRLPTMATVLWVLVAELILAFWIHDNLTLNILMLIHPIDAIRRWQMAV
jgi:hypothetical protein